MRADFPMPSVYQAPIWFFLARRQRLAYLLVPKVASTSLRAALCLLNHPELPREQVLDPDVLQKNKAWNDMAPAATADLRGLFRFTFVRDPFARFLSFHRNKIAAATPATLRPRFAQLGLAAGLSLADTLTRVEAIPPGQLDAHIVPQSLLVYSGGKPRVDFIGHIEQFGADLARVEEQAGVKLDIQQLNATAAPPRDPRETLDPAIRERLARLYADDLANFGYAP